jgi:formylglycine-generating enzyme required for sulfatase activity
MTQGQWGRLWHGDEDLRCPSQFKPGETGSLERVSLAHPVEQLSWAMCHRLAQQHGFTLPTEAQWEYACRAETTTPWSCTESELATHANLADQSAARRGLSWGRETWDDGHVLPARIGSFAPNRFGLFDMHGNVWEYCLDGYGAYSSPVRVGDGLRLATDGSGDRILRGGSYNSGAKNATSASRNSHPAGLRLAGGGLRPARPVRRP